MKLLIIQSYKFTKLVFGIYLGLSAWSLGFTSPVAAQSVNLSIDPPVVEMLLAPSKKVTQTFTFSYQGTQTMVTPEIHLVKPSDESGHVTIDPKPLIPGSIPLIISSSMPLNVPYPLTTQNFPLTLTFEAANSDQVQDVYLAVVFKTNSEPSFAHQSLGVGGAISALILTTITPSDGLPIDLEVKNFTPPLLHDSWLPLSATPILENHTSTMVRPEGTFAVIAPTGKTKLKLDLYPNLILGDASRSILSKDNKPLSWSPSWYDIGPYRLHLTINTESGRKVTEVEKTVWLFPIRIISVLILILILGMRLLSRAKAKSLDVDTPSKD